METDCPTPQEQRNIFSDQVKQLFKPMCFFSFQKRKLAVPVKITQDKTPMALEDEIKLLDNTVVWKELSTSLSTETEDKELKMLRKAAPPTVRQEQEEVSLGLSSCKQDNCVA